MTLEEMTGGRGFYRAAIMSLASLTVHFENRLSISINFETGLIIVARQEPRPPFIETKEGNFFSA